MLEAPLSDDPQQRRVAWIAMGISLLVAVLMLSGKMVAFFLTHSTAIFADAAESVVHLVATAFAVFSMWYAQQPADPAHPYGHRRITYLSIGFEGALVLSTGVVVVVASVRALFGAAQLNNLEYGVAITGALAMINVVLGISLRRIGRRIRSAVMQANGQHVLADVWTSVGAVFGAGAAWLTGRNWLDPAFAGLLGVWVLISGVQLLRDAYFGVMDRADPDHTEALIARLDDAVRCELIAGYHQLRHRAIDDDMWVEVHLLLDGETSTHEAHQRATEVESTLRAALPAHRIAVTSHVEPVAHHRAHPSGHEQRDPRQTRERVKLTRKS
ncbi:MAG: cation transporter [Deltaproteobacteria bacterium]|nr:cation transporter [Deltaproteobacteria bacterium]